MNLHKLKTADDVLLSLLMIVIGKSNNPHTPSLYYFNSFLANIDFRCLLITFANNLDPDQDQRSVGPDLDPTRFTL